MPDENAVLPVLLAGAVAGLVSKGTTYPLDTVKVQLQLQSVTSSLQRLTTLSVCQQIVAEDGIKGFYRGFSALAVGVVPANMAYYGGYGLAKRHLGGSDSFWADAAAGAAAQLAASIVYTPVDIVKERLQTAQGTTAAQPQLRTPSQVLASMWGQHGVRGLFKGYWVTNAVWLPWSMIYVSGYEQLKRTSALALGLPAASDLPAWALAGCSLTAATVAVSCTHPLDVVKTRLQVLSSGDAYLTATTVAWDLLRSKNWKALTLGFTARAVNIAPGTTLSWVVYEAVKPLLARQAWSETTL